VTAWLLVLARDSI